MFYNWLAPYGQLEQDTGTSAYDPLVDPTSSQLFTLFIVRTLCRERLPVKRLLSSQWKRGNRQRFSHTPRGSPRARTLTAVQTDACPKGMGAIYFSMRFSTRSGHQRAGLFGYILYGIICAWDGCNFSEFVCIAALNQRWGLREACICHVDLLPQALYPRAKWGPLRLEPVIEMSAIQFHSCFKVCAMVCDEFEHSLWCNYRLTNDPL